MIHTTCNFTDEKKFNMKTTKKPPSLKSNKSKEQQTSNKDIGLFLLSQAKNIQSDNPNRALQLAIRARESFEKDSVSNPEPDLDLVMCLHVMASIYCKLDQHNEAISILRHANTLIPTTTKDEHNCLAKFCGCMQLGDTYATLGHIQTAIICYLSGLDIQIQALGPHDYRVGNTYRYIAEAYIQALEFDEAEKFCLKALEVHKEEGQTADRRLLGLICDMKGNYEEALEHLVLANCQEPGVASIDCSIGDTYLSLLRYDEAICSYQKALAHFKATKGDKHHSVASIIVRLANLYNKINKPKDAKAYCESALKIYENPDPGTPREDIANGLTEISAIYESMQELEKAINLLKKATKIKNSPAIEAQLGVMYYIKGDYMESYRVLKSSVEKLRVCEGKKPAYFGMILNQMGLACVEINEINEAMELFEEARNVLEKEYGPYHPDTLCVCSNLAGTYDATGRLEDAIELLKYVVRAREGKLEKSITGEEKLEKSTTREKKMENWTTIEKKIGKSDFEEDHEKQRLLSMMREKGRNVHRRNRSLEEILAEDGLVFKTKTKGELVHFTNSTTNN